VSAAKLAWALYVPVLDAPETTHVAVDEFGFPVTTARGVWELQDVAAPVMFQLTFPVGAGPPDGVVRLAVKVKVSTPAVVVTAEETCNGATVIRVGPATALV
jgi:hypothetical protein